MTTMSATICGKKYLIRAKPLAIGDDVILALDGHRWVYLKLLNTRIEDVIVENGNNIGLMVRGLAFTEDYGKPKFDYYDLGYVYCPYIPELKHEPRIVGIGDMA